MWARCLLLAIGVPLSGCAAVSGYPKPVLDPRAEDAELAPYVGQAAIANYEACADKVACRNTIIDARLRAVDLAFYRFIRKIYGQEGRVSLGSDVLAMTLDSIAAVTATKPLAAGASVLSGGRDAYEKQVLNLSMPPLFEEMVAKRRELLLRIRQGETMPVATYTLFQALDDISEYELAGSIPSAAAELGAGAGADARAAQTKLDALRAAAFAAATPATSASGSTPTGTAGAASKPAMAPSAQGTSTAATAGSPSITTP